MKIRSLIEKQLYFQASSSDPSSPSTPTTRRDLYLPLRRPSLMESVINMTKEIATNKTNTDSSESENQYPANQSIVSDNEKKTVSCFEQCCPFLFYIHT